MSFTALLTDAGRAMMAAANNGATLRLTTFGIDEGEYTPTPDQSALVNEVHSGAISNVYQKPDDATVLVVEVVLGVDLGPFTMRAVGLYAESGTLVAIVQTPETEVVPASQGFAAEMRLNIYIPHAGNANIELTINASQVYASHEYVDQAVGGIVIEDVPEGSETQTGVLQLATPAETQAGALENKAIHPKGLASVHATTTRRGLVELATVTEAKAGSDTNLAITPSTLAATLNDRLANWLTSGDLNAALDALRTELAALVIPIGAVCPFDRTDIPTGWLELNGATLQIDQFPELYAVLGTRYGGNGTTTFGLRDARDYFVRAKSASRGLGSLQQDALQDHIHTISYIGSWGEGYDMNNSTFNEAGGLSGTGNVDPNTAVSGGTPRTAGETRPKNIAYPLCIKAF